MKKTEMERKHTRDLIHAKEEAQRGKDREKLIGVSYKDAKKEFPKQNTSSKEL